jgi:hypothetical protein
MKRRSNTGKINYKVKARLSISVLLLLLSLLTEGQLIQKASLRDHNEDIIGPAGNALQFGTIVNSDLNRNIDLLSEKSPIKLSVNTKGYFLTDATVSYSKANVELGLALENLFNLTWHEDYLPASNHDDKLQQVSDYFFTPGQTFIAKARLSIFF